MLQLSSLSIHHDQKNSSKDQVRKMAMKLVRSGELSRAARVLVSSGLAPATEETVQKLAAKHPARKFQT